MTQDSNYNSSGGSRFEDEGKAYGWWFAPLPGIKYVVKVAKDGAKKYAPLDWAEGQDFSTLYGCAFRHMIDAHPANKGILSVNEDDGDQMHIAHAAWNLLCLLSLVAMGKADECNDMDEWRGITSSDVPDGEDYESWSPGDEGGYDTTRERRRVGYWDVRHGFGLTEEDQSGECVYLDYTEIIGEGFKSLDEGDLIEYDRVMSKKGPKAENIKKIAPGREDSYTSGSAIEAISPDSWR